MKLQLLLALVFATTCCQSSNLTDGSIVSVKRRPQFLRTEAERWSFNQQIKDFLKDNSQKIQQNARNFIAQRKQDQAKLSDYNLTTNVEEPSGEKWRADLLLRKGSLVGLQSIMVSFESILSYDRLSVMFSCDIKFLENIKISYDVSLLKGNSVRDEGTTVGQAKILHYRMTSRMDLINKTIEVLGFERRFCGGIDVLVNLPGDGAKIADRTRTMVSELFAGPIMDDVEILTKAALKEGASQIGEASGLPNYDYAGIVEENIVNRKKRNATCPKNSTEEIETPKIIKRGINLRAHDYLPFIQNDAEKWSFEEQLIHNLKEYLSNLVSKAKLSMTERGLKQAKLPDYELKKYIKKACGVDYNATLKMTNGWVSGMNNFANSGAKLLKLSKTTITITASVHLTEPIELKQDFVIGLNGKTYNGFVNGKMKTMTYSYRIIVNLETYKTLLEDFRVECIGETTAGVTVYDSNDTCVERVVREATIDLLHGPITDDIENLIYQDVGYVALKTEMQNYLPKWNYKRVFEKKFYAKPQHRYQICDHGNWELFNHSGKGSNTVVKRHQVPFINTELELQAFGDRLAMSMNKYVRAIVKEAKKIIIQQDLQKAKLPLYIRPLSAKDFSGTVKFGVLSFINGVVEDLSKIFQRNDSIEILEFTADEIIITARIPVWRHLKFYSDIVVSIKDRDARGNLTGEIESAVYHVKIRIDYLRSKNATVEEMNLHCVKGLTLRTHDFSEADKWMADPCSDRAVSFFSSDIWRDVHLILRRSLEDAILNVNLDKFLPAWDYKKNQTAKPGMRSEELKICQDVGTNKDSFSGNKNATVGFDKIFPQIRTKALRKDIENKIKFFSSNYMDKMWDFTTHILSERYSRLKLPKRSISFVLRDTQGKDRNVTLKLGNGTLSGLTSPDVIHNRDIKIGENNTIIFFSLETFKNLKVLHEFNLKIGKNQQNASITISIGSVKYSIETRFDIESNEMKKEGVTIQCVEQMTNEIRGLSEENKWITDVIVKETIALSVFPLLTDFSIELLETHEDTLRQEGDKFPLPAYIRDRELRRIAENDGDRQKKLKDREGRIKDNCSEKLETPDVTYEDHKSILPFIGTKAEWWYFNSEMRKKMDTFKKDVLKGVQDYLALNHLEKITLSDYAKRFTAEEKVGGNSNIVELTAKNGTAENLSRIDDEGYSDFRYEKNEVIFRIPIRFKHGIKFGHAFNVSTKNAQIHGRTEGSVEELRYFFEARIDLHTKQIKLEEPVLECIGGLKVEVKGLSLETHWLSIGISSQVSEIFLGSILDDAEKILHIALQDEVLSINKHDYGKFYLPAWNYAGAKVPKIGSAPNVTCDY